MRISKDGINLIKKFEGCVLKVYLDAVGIKTVGYGHTGSDVNALAIGTQITQQHADELLKSDLSKFEQKVEWYYPIYHWTQNEFDAMVSFAFNVGSIDQLTANGTRSKEVIAQKILQYNKAGGRVLPGLTKRRQAEHDLFIGNESSRSDGKPTLKIGSKGEAVKSVQTYLSILGYQIGNIDGQYGKQTASCVKHYQEEHRLKIDGIWGNQCWDSVGK